MTSTLPAPGSDEGNVSEFLPIGKKEGGNFPHVSPFSSPCKAANGSAGLQHFYTIVIFLIIERIEVSFQ